MTAYYNGTLWDYMTNHIFLVLLLCLCPRILVGQLSESKARFVEDVLFITEYESSPSRNCKRWVTPPILSVFGKGALHPSLIERVVNHLNANLPSELQIEMAPPRTETATIKLYFDNYDNLGQIAEENGCQFTEGNLGFFFCWWNSNFEIEKAIVLIAEDKLSGYRLNHFVLEELTQSLGFPGDSNRQPKSVFYEDKNLSKFGSATSLSRDDKELLRFHYHFNQPGEGPVKVGINLSQYFRERQSK